MKLVMPQILFQIIVLVSAGFIHAVSRLTPLDRSTRSSSTPMSLPVMTSLEDLKQMSESGAWYYLRLTIIVLTMPADAFSWPA